MRRLAAAVLVAGAAFLPVWAGAPLEVASPLVGIVYLDGKVEVRTGEGSWRAAAVGDVLREGDGLRTGEASSAVLVLWDKTAMKIAPETRIAVVDLAENGGLVRRFRLEVGRVWADVQKSLGGSSTFEVEGPQAVAAVKGTSFEMVADGDETEIYVWEGIVEGRSGSKVWTMKAFERCRARRDLVRQLAFQAAQADAWQRWNLESRPRLARLLKSLPRRIDLRNPRYRRACHEVIRKLPPSYRKAARERHRSLRRDLRRPDRPGLRHGRQRGG